MKKITLLTSFVLLLTSCTAQNASQLPPNGSPSPSPTASSVTTNSSAIPVSLPPRPTPTPSPIPLPSSTIPTGFSMVADAGANPGGNFGAEVSMVLDENDEPLIAYINDTSDHRNIGLFFTRWDKTTNRWKNPVRAATMDLRNGEVGDRQVSIARDPITGTIGIAFQKTTDHINFDPDISFIYSTDGGVSWSGGERVGENHFNTNYGESNPSLAIYNNKVHVGFFSSWVRCQAGQCNSMIYATKELGKGVFTYTTSPLLPDTGQNTTPLSLAINSKGVPGIANYLAGKVDQNGVQTGPLRVVYWEPQSGTFESIDSTMTQNDFRSISLAYNVDKPAVTYQMFKNSNLVPPNIWYSTKRDTSLQNPGLPWNTPVNVADDPARNGGSWLSLALSSNGTPSIAYEFSQGSASDRCGSPLLASYSTSSGWSMCAPPKSYRPLSYMDGFSGEFMNMAYDRNGKRIMVFRQTVPATNERLSIGVAIWKEPEQLINNRAVLP